MFRQPCRRVLYLVIRRLCFLSGRIPGISGKPFPVVFLQRLFPLSFPPFLAVGSANGDELLWDPVESGLSGTIFLENAIIRIFRRKLRKAAEQPGIVGLNAGRIQLVVPENDGFLFGKCQLTVHNDSSDLRTCACFRLMFPFQIPAFCFLSRRCSCSLADQIPAGSRLFRPDLRRAGEWHQSAFRSSGLCSLSTRSFHRKAAVQPCWQTAAFQYF